MKKLWQDIDKNKKKPSLHDKDINIRSVLLWVIVIGFLAAIWIPFAIFGVIAWLFKD
ncbi:MAG: hypothetical protein HGA90_01380 [Alphaproteobacteria bacterium]|nr:hypothetical protein [Alphaproteobacteria bacterium]